MDDGPCGRRLAAEHSVTRIMETTEIHRGIVNQGAFFSPYYLFDLLQRQHADELDPKGREANRRLLRRPFRNAWARYSDTGSTAGQAWQAWHRELFEALGFRLQRLDTPIETARHGLVPISRAAYLTTDDGQPTTGDEPPLVFVDLHGFGTDLDRDCYPQSPISNLHSPITEETIARAIEFALDYNDARWAILAAGDRLRLYRKGGSVARQYLEVNFPALFDADRNDEWAAFWGLFRYEAFVPDPETGKCLLDRVLEESQRHASRIADDLRENIVTAVEALIQGILDDPSNHPTIQRRPEPVEGPSSQPAIQQLFEEALYFLYRLLFILYAESRDLLPVGESPVYRDTYSVEHLREMAERPLHAEDADKTYYIETLRTLFKMLHQGFPPPGSALSPGFDIPPFNGQLFDPARTALLDRCRIPDRAMRQVIRELSLSRPRRRSDRRERYSYADLGVDQLGSIYEGLLVYEPAIVTEETVVARVKGEERLVSRAQAEEYGLPIVVGADGHPPVKRPGSFVLRLWGGRRKGTGSYYTPQEITSFLVKEALEPLVEPIVEGCAPAKDSPSPSSPPVLGGTEGGPKARHPEEILEIKVCDPAMGSGAFLIQACRYLAEAYGRARIAAGLDEDQRISPAEFAAYKRRVAEKCLYGVDLNPMAVELAKVSLWLETLASDRPLTFLDAHLRCGNSLIGAPLRDEDGHFSVERITVIPDEALKEVSKEATREQKAEARERIKRNRMERARAGRGDTPQTGMWDQQYADAIQTALTDTLTRRLDLETSDEDLPMHEAVALVQEKEHLFDQLQHAADSRYRQAKQVCDLWCAVWFWPAGDEGERGRGGNTETVTPSPPLPLPVSPPPPTTQVFLELAGHILDVDPGSLTDAEREAYLAVAEHVAREQRFFHWELEFPEVWREKDGRPKKNGGFDAVVGNPPWDVIQPLSQEFWSNYDPLFRELNKQEALKRIEEYRADPTRDQSWREYQLSFAQQSHWFKRNGEFRYVGPGKNDTYKLFLERGHNVLRKHGGLGLVLPSGVYTDLSSRDLRQLVFEMCQVRYLLAFANERFVFPSIHHAFRFVLLTLQRGGQTEALRSLFRLNVHNAVAPEEMAGLLASLQSVSLDLTLRDIRRFSPDTLSPLEFKNQREVDIAAEIYNDHPLLGEELNDTWNVRFTQEVNMTSDSQLFRNRAWLEKGGHTEQRDRTWLGPDGKLYLPLYEGKMVHQFEHRFAEPRYWLAPEAKAQLLAKHGASAWPDTVFRIGWRDVSAATNERTLLCAALPLASGCGHTLPATQTSTLTSEQSVFLAGLWNSFSIDFLARMRVTNHLTFSILQHLPIPRCRRGQLHFDAIVLNATRLTCVAPEFAQLWNEVAQHYPDTVPTPWRPEHAATDPRERAQLRAEIDALVADLYGLSQEDFAYILTTFPLLDRDQPALPDEPKSFITRDLALLALFRLRGETPPADIVDFFAGAGADIREITGPIRDLEQRVYEAAQLGAVAYIPSGRGGDVEMGPADAELQLRLFED